MPDPAPVASNLLESKFLCLSVKRLAESLAIPLAPCAVLYTIGFPLTFTFPLFVIGSGIGGQIFLKTPPGQRPLRYAPVVYQYKTGSNVYHWQHPAPENSDLGTGVTQVEWITTPPTGITGKTPVEGRDDASSSGVVRTQPEDESVTLEDGL